MRRGILAATFVAAFGTLVTLPFNFDLTNSTARAQPLPDCARPSSVSNCSGSGKIIACSKEGTCLDITGQRTRGCLGYVCKMEQDREDQLREELKALEEAKQRQKEETLRAEQEKLREEEQRRAAEGQGPPAPEPVPSGGAGAGTAANPPPCVGQGGGADDCLGSGGMVVPGVKTAPGNFDIYKK